MVALVLATVGGRRVQLDHRAIVKVVEKADRVLAWRILVRFVQDENVAQADITVQYPRLLPEVFVRYMVLSK